MQTHIPKICSDFLQNHIDKRMFEIYNKFTVKEQTFANICFESMGGIYYDDRIQRKYNCYTKHSQKCTPRKMSYQKNKMQTFPFCQYVFDLSGNSCRTPFYQRRCKCRCTGTLCFLVCLRQCEGAAKFDIINLDVLDVHLHVSIFGLCFEYDL